jgi:hypothetical protein
VRCIGLRLTRPGGAGEFIRAIVPLADLAAGGGERAPAQDAALRALIEQGLVRITQEGEAICGRLAHDVLIRDWDRLRAWLNDERAFLLWHERLQAALEQWRGRQKSRLALLAGTALAEASGWKQDRHAALTAEELYFIERSERRRRRTPGIAIAVLVLLTIAGFLLAWFVERKLQEVQDVRSREQSALASAQAARANAEQALAAEREARTSAQQQAALASDTIATLRQSESQLRRIVEQRTAASEDQRRSLRQLQQQIDSLTTRGRLLVK